MNKVLKLHVTYSGNYGGDVNEIVIIPEELNGVLFDKLPINTILEKRIDLGEIEGKHSQCYGDLEIELIDLDELNLKEVSDLIGLSYFGEFEVFFEDSESAFKEERDDEEDDEEREFKKDVLNKVLNKYNVDPEGYGILTGKVHEEFINNLKKKYLVKFKNITIKEKDYQKVLEILKTNEIEIFNQ